MIRNFIKKKGDQFTFGIVYPYDVDFSSVEMGIKKAYTDEDFIIYKSLKKYKSKVVFIGDSYAEGYTPDGNVVGWPRLVIEKLNLNTSIIKCKGGTGFSKSLQNGTFTDLINQLNDDSSVTDVIVAGGYNDRYGTRNEILEGIKNFCTVSKNKFPNANIKISMVGWSSKIEQQSSLNDTIASYKQGCIENNIVYMDKVEDSIHNDIYFSSDQVHPNQSGEFAISENISSYITTYYGGDITKIDDRTYQINIPYTEMEKLDYGMYDYDVRTKVGNIPTTPLSGKLIIRETVYYTKD